MLVAMFLIPDSVSIDPLIDTLAERYTTKVEPVHHQQHTYYDTFDWALYHAGLSLCRSSGEYTLRSLPNDRILQTVPWNSKAPLDFPGAFSQNLVSVKLRRTLALRALQRKGTLEAELQTVHIPGKAENTVLHLRTESVQGMKAPGVTSITLKPSGTSGRNYRDLSRLLARFGEKREPAEIFELVLSAAGVSPARHVVTRQVRLQPDIAAQDATVIILRGLLDVMKQNVSGITADVDTECLHDFRVAVRRTRSILAQIKDIFPSAIIRQFRGDFASLGRASNDLRDLDLCLLNRRSFEKLLPAGLRPGLNPLFDILRIDRTRHHGEFVALLQRVFRPSLQKRWEIFLSNPTSGESRRPANADKPIIDVAQTHIFRQYHRVMDLGRTLDGSTPDADIHALRIQCKNLRYLHEFFASLFPPSEGKALVKSLKSLQNDLGTYNDLCIQQSQFERAAHRMGAKTTTGGPTTAAVGDLAAAMREQQNAARTAFTGSIKDFSDVNNARLYRELFA